MRQSAVAPHPTFISYDEDIRITAHGSDIVREIAHVDYRDDGTALVLDDRNGGQPLVTTHLDPGPPELGPYGSARGAWMSQGDWPQLRTVADVRVQGSESCQNAGLVTEGGTQEYHLLFARTQSATGLKELWVDAQTAQIRRVVITGLIRFTGSGIERPADFSLDLADVQGFSVISHIGWSMEDYTGDIKLENFAFPTDVTALDTVPQK